MIALLIACGPKIDPGPVPVDRWVAPIEVLAEEGAEPGQLHLVALVRAGSGFDPIGREGLAWLVAQSIAKHGVATEIDTEWVRFWLDCPAAEATRCIDQFASALARPELDAWDALRAQAAEAPRAVDDALHIRLFEGHRTGHPLGGWPEVVPSLTVEEGRRFHETHYRRATMVAGVLASDAETKADELRESLLEVRGGPPADDAWMRPPIRESRDLVVLESEPAEPDDSAWTIAFGQVLRVPVEHPDVPHLAIAAAALARALTPAAERPGPEGDADDAASPVAEVRVALEPLAGLPRRSVTIVGAVRPTTQLATAEALTDIVNTLRDWPHGIPEGRHQDSQAPNAQALWLRLASHVAPHTVRTVVAPEGEGIDRQTVVSRHITFDRWQFVVFGDPGDTSALGFDSVARPMAADAHELP